ncbi:unnamed protein product [Somion occarium]
MRYPKLVALDLDGTVWYHWLNDKKFKTRVTRDIADNLEPVGHDKVRDKKNHANVITMSPDVPRIITELALRKIDIAIVSRNTSKALCDRALWYFKARNPETKQMRPITSFIKYDEVKDESKQEHFKRIKNWSGYEYHDMLIFDDQPLNLEVETWEGVTFKLVKHHNDGLTWQDYLDGLDEWRKNQYIRVAQPPRLIDPHPNKMLIGYAGTDRETALLYVQGKRRQFTKRPARFGYGLYASDNPQIAMFFSQWGRDNGDKKVCEIFVRDKDVFLNELKKIWFYPKTGYLTNNQHSKAEDIAKMQIKRDEYIHKHHHVEKPYILFSRHHYMHEMGKSKYNIVINSKKRFNEMVIYPQVQDALMFGTTLSLPQARKMTRTGKLKKLQHEKKVSAWGIKVPSETKEDSTNHGENHYFG